MQNYLKDRTQRKMFNNQLSDLVPIISGVPQGSLIGPCMFNFYIKDINCCDTSNYMIKYADDTIVIIPHIKDKDPYQSILSEIKCVNDWCEKKGLKINTNKSKIMAVHKRNHFDCLLDPLKLDYELVNELKFLGVVWNSYLNWKDHSKGMCSNYCSRMAVLRV